MRHFRRVIPLAVAVLLLLAGFTSRSDAQVIAWDSFESYGPGGNLNGSSGGYGWGGNNWATTGSDVTVQTTSMTPPLGGSQAARILPITSVAGDNNAVMQRAFSAFGGNLAVGDNPVYVAVLLRHVYNAQDDFLQVQLSDGAVGNDANTLSFGVHNVAGKPLFARVGQSGNTASSAINSVSGTDYLVIARFSKDAGLQFGRTDIFINQFAQGAANATAVSTTPSITQFDLFNVRLNNVENNDAAFIDQIAIAGTFDQLFPQLTTTPNTTGTANFGNTRVGTTNSQVLTATNTGSFTLMDLAFNDPSNPLFARVGVQAGSNLITLATDSRTYGFSPTARGAASGTATITGDRGTPVGDPGRQLSSTVNLMGNAVGPVFAFTIDDIGAARSGTPLPGGENNGNVALSTGETIDFGEGAGNRTAQLTLSNVTTDGDLGSLTDLTILSGAFSGPNAAQFELFESDGVTPFVGGDVLSAGETLDLVVQFSGEGALPELNTALLTLVTDQGAAFGGNGGTFTFNVQAFEIPEPSSLLLFALAGLGFAGNWLRRSVVRLRP